MRPSGTWSLGNAVDSIRSTTFRSRLLQVMIPLGVAFVSYAVYSRMGNLGLVLLTGFLAIGSLLSFVSARYLAIPVLIWILSLMGLRPLLMLRTPGLPDLSADRFLLVWIGGVMLLKSVMGEKPKPRFQTLDTLLILHALYLLGSILIRRSQSMNSWTQSYLMGYSAYFIAKYVIAGNMRWIKTIFVLFIVLNVYHGITSIAEHFHIYPLIWPKLVLNQRAYDGYPGRSHGIFLQPGVLGTVMGMQLPALFYFLRTSRSRLIRIILYGCLPVILGGLYFTYTRGAWLATIVAILVVAAVGWRRYLPLIGRLALIGLVLIGSGVVGIKQDKFFKERLENEDTVTGRIGTLARASRVFLDNPLFGCGYGKYNEVKREYSGSAEVPIFGTIKRSRDVSASLHDNYIGTLAEEGLVGAGLQFFIYLQAYWIIRRKLAWADKGDHVALYVVPAIAGTLLGYLAGAVAFDYRYFASLNSIFYLSIGLVAGYDPEDHATAEAEAAAEPRPSHGGSRPVFAPPV